MSGSRDKFFNNGSEETVPLTLHWNGTSWTRVATPNPGGKSGGSLTAVSADSATDAWAVGIYEAPHTQVNKSLALKWNGHAWKQLAAPNPGQFGFDL